MRRHDRVYLRPAAPFETACAPPDSPAGQALATWIAHGRPLVAARQAAGEAGIRLGLTLPLAHGRQRLTVRVAADDIASVQAPLDIARCLPRVTEAAVPALQMLADAVDACGARIGIYGSLAWETLSGAAYRHADSDIDVICDVTTPAQLAPVLAALQAADASLPCALDGEIRFPDGYAANWREIAACGGRPDATVLAKGESDVCLLPLAALLGALDGERRHA